MNVRCVADRALRLLIVAGAGTFSPNAAIDHTFADVFSGYAYLRPKPNACTVRARRYKDGSSRHARGLGARRQTP